MTCDARQADVGGLVRALPMHEKVMAEHVDDGAKGDDFGREDVEAVVVVERDPLRDGRGAQPRHEVAHHRKQNKRHCEVEQVAAGLGEWVKDAVGEGQPVAVTSEAGEGDEEADEAKEYGRAEADGKSTPTLIQTSARESQRSAKDGAAGANAAAESAHSACSSAACGAPRRPASRCARAGSRSDGRSRRGRKRHKRHYCRGAANQ
mmetsp:Transcript_26400/g.46974  ORF Transcript_26400/g.46974 Transcript_26400/m.46974 type:complete len:206 (-) Transcript_26400:115-732(-)